MTVPEQGGHTPFQYQHHLCKGERTVLAHMAAGLIPLADYVADARFKGELQQRLVRSDIDDFQAAFQQLF